MRSRAARPGILLEIPSTVRAALATALTYLFAFFFTFLMVSAACIASILGLRGVLTALVAAWARMPFWLVGRRLHIRGSERIARSGRYLVVANHSSMYDIPAMLAVMPNLAIMGREKLLRIPLFGFFLRRINYIPVDTSSIRKAADALRVAVERTQEGLSVGMFPEGTRTMDGQVHRLMRGFVRVLREGRLDLLPLRIDGTWTLKPKNHWYMDPRERIEVKIRPPIAYDRLAHLGDDEIVDMVRRQIMAHPGEQGATRMKRTDGWVFIVNPIAGNGFGASLVPTVKEMMARHGADGEVVLTKGKGHATELAAEHAAKGAKKIIGVGGDGTMSEIAQALVGRRGVTFGAVPAGTGNDFIQILGFPDRLDEELWDIFFQAAETGMDVGRCNKKYFINGMGLGFDAQVAMDNYHMENGGEVEKGSSKAKYTWHIVKNILFYHEKPMRVTLEGRTVEQCSFLNTISIGRRMAGGIFITPKAFADDGLLDVCMTDPLSVPMRFKELISFSRQTHLSDPVVHYHQVNKVTFEFDDKAPAHLDGEVTFAQRFDIDILPKALRVIYNPKGPHYFGKPGV
ncbi:MAG: hypothetical protein A2177_09900 [Spirochaetes bacterium RBG_13_68_11]|nr:MAG: hypothetical protein A2177_09900 [Spirochaetes bacterium RBG_13_68_11]